jgi:uncharacterized protein
VRRIVADTNIYISALIFCVLPDDVLAVARRKRAELFVCEPIFEEIQRVLDKKFHWSSERIREALFEIQKFATPVDLQERVTVVEKDDADNRIIECALAAHAEIIVTGDLHLLELATFRDIRILTARAFLDEIR